MERHLISLLDLAEKHLDMDHTLILVIVLPITMHLGLRRHREILHGFPVAIRALPEPKGCDLLRVAISVSEQLLCMH